MPKRLPGLPAAAFMHPADREALDILRTTPGFETVFRKIMHYGFEKAYRIQLMGSAVKISPTQCPSLYAKFVEAKAVLDIHDEIELFTLQNPNINAMTFGAEKVGIIMHTSTIEHLTDDELFYILCHELGHVKCGHTLYRFIAIILAEVILRLGHMTLGIGAILSQGLLVALLSWYRKSELSADRAGLLGVQDLAVAQSATMKLAGGSQRIFEEMNLDEFEEQAKDVEGSDSIIDALLQMWLTMPLTHPWLSVRAKELRKWAKDGNYQQLLAGDYPTAATWAERERTGGNGHQEEGEAPTPSNAVRLCFECKTANDYTETKCRNCGASLIRIRRG